MDHAKEAFARRHETEAKAPKTSELEHLSVRLSSSLGNGAVLINRAENLISRIFGPQPNSGETKNKLSEAPSSLLGELYQKAADFEETFERLQMALERLERL